MTCDLFIYLFTYLFSGGSSERGIHQHSAAPLLPPLALAAFTHHPLILSAAPRSSPPPPCLILLPLLHPLPASSPSCSRCGVAIATEKCGNTSVLQSAGKGRRDCGRAPVCVFAVCLCVRAYGAGEEERTEEGGRQRDEPSGGGGRGEDGSVEKTVN